MRRKYNRRIRPARPCWSERHPMAADALGALALGVMGYVMTVLVFCL